MMCFTQKMQQLLDDTPHHIAVACSGGADSLALALLAHEWARAEGATLSVLIVDHGLRAESAAEAQQVANWLGDRAIDCHLLALNMDAGNALQERARQARYAAMTQWCRAHGASHLLVGHHRDDQMETCVFRLLRGSGLDGLAGMSARRELDGVTLLRPLLGTSKSQCEEYLRMRGQEWVRDPSNDNARFDRVKIRRFLAHQSEAHRDRVADLARRFGVVRQRYETVLNTLAKEYMTPHEYGAVWVDERITALPDGLVIDLLARALVHVNGDEAMPRYAEVARLWESLKAGNRHTLHYCMIAPHRDGWLVMREPGRVAPRQPLVQGVQRWDKRFEVRWSGKPGYEIAALGEDGWRLVKESGAVAGDVDRLAALSFPAVCRLEALVAVPHIGYYSDKNAKAALRVATTAANTLAAQTFYVMNDEI